MKLFLFFFTFCNLVGYSQSSDFDHFNFKKADSIALHLQGESLQNLPVLTHQLTSNLATDVEKFRAIYTWVSTNIKNDYPSSRLTSNKRRKIPKDSLAFLAWNDKNAPKMIEKLRSKKETACTGYAYLIREMAALAGIESKIVDGFGRTATTNLSTHSQANHSWNMVKLNNKWYLCDATWSAGKTLIVENEPVFTFNYNDGYFLADPELFIKNHFPLQIENTLLSKNPTFEDFLAGPLVYNGAFKKQLISIAPSRMRFEVSKKEAVFFSIQFPDKELLTEIHIVLNDSQTPETINITDKRNPYVFSYSFQRKGVYDVHLSVDNTIVATYVVKVKN